MAEMIVSQYSFFLLLLEKNLPTFNWKYGNSATHSSFPAARDGHVTKFQPMGYHWLDLRDNLSVHAPYDVLFFFF